MDNLYYNRKKVLLICRNIDGSGGGVINYYRVVSKHDSIKRGYFFHINEDESTRNCIIIQTLKKLFEFFKILTNRQIAIVHVNPSLLWRAVARDATIIFFLGALRKRL